MKIGILSDLHIDRNHQEDKPSIIDSLSSEINAKSIDYMLIAGDISNQAEQSIAALNEIERKTGSKCLFVPGNHDLWNKHKPEEKARDTYVQLQQFYGNVCGEAFHLTDEWVVIGDIGWYDYTFGDQQFNQEGFNRMAYLERIWHDREYVNWEMSNQEVCQTFYDKLDDQLQSHQGKKIILVLHVVPHAQFIVQNPNETWKYFNAFLGSTRYHELIQKHEVAYAVFGHVHYRFTRKIGKSKYICQCLGTLSEWRHSDDPREEISNALYVFEI